MFLYYSITIIKGDIMGVEIPVRYRNSVSEESLFSPGDVIYSILPSTGGLIRYIIDTDIGSNIYIVFRISDKGEKSGTSIRLNERLVASFKKDFLSTNLMSLCKKDLL
jgi:hypothetical protein